MKLAFKSALGAAALGIAAALAGAPSQAEAKQLTLCWAAWDPANALVELSKDFTAKTGIEMKFEFVPWTSYADRFLNELNSHGKLCDLIIGDSQWIGGAAENGWGVNFTHQGTTIFGTLFDYDNTGRDVWLFAAMARQSDGSFTGQMALAAGPPYYSQPWPATFSPTVVGTMTFRPSAKESCC